MANYPTSLDDFSNPSGTTITSTLDHALQHSNVNDVVEVLEAKVGLSSGTPIADSIFVGSGNGTSVWSGTWNNATMGSPTITGGTITSGVINAATVGTPAVTGGTITDPTIEGTVAGTTIFSGFPQTAGTPSNNNDLANKQYVDSVGVEVIGTTGNFSGVDSTGTYTPAAGSVQIILTQTADVMINTSCDAYSNPGTLFGDYITTQITKGAAGIGLQNRTELYTGNVRTNVAMTFVDAGLVAGTYDYGVQFRANSGTVTIEQGQISVLSVQT